MMGASKQIKRNELLAAKHSGLDKDIHWWVQTFLFDRGHAVEAAALPLVEKIIGDDLYPATATDDDGRLLASFDGITMLGDTLYEHKLWNETLAEQVRNKELDPHYYWQLEQQLLVSGAERVIFVTSDGTPEKFESMVYRAIAGRAESLLAGWKQFEADLANFIPAPVAVEAVGRAPDQLPALHIELTGLVTASNLAEFRDTAIAVFRGISTDLHTDQDFANADKTVKWCGDIEDRLKAAKDHALSQTQSIDELFRAIDSISAEARSKRLELEKLVKARKEAVRGEIAYAGRDAITAHYATINATLGEHALTVPATIGSDLNAAIKGKRTIASIHDAVDTTVAAAKIAASQKADQVRACIATLAEHAKGHESLFADRVQLCSSKSPEDLRNLIAARVSDYQAREAARIEADRERIRKEEVSKLEAEHAAEELANAKKSEGAELSPEAQKLNESEGTQRFTNNHRGITTRQPVVAPASKEVDSARPTASQLVSTIAATYYVTKSVAAAWLRDIDLSSIDVAA
jgi:predicted phage-related endonuclease